MTLTEDIKNTADEARAYNMIGKAYLILANLPEQPKSSRDQCLFISGAYYGLRDDTRIILDGLMEKAKEIGLEVDVELIE